MRQLVRKQVGTAIAMSLLTLAACSAGAGAIGVDIIAQREGPGVGTAPSAPLPDDAPSAPPTTRLSCAGAYTCSIPGGGSSISASLAEVDGRCEAEYEGVRIILETDGKITVGGSVYGSWELRADGTFNVCTTDSTCATCARGTGATEAGTKKLGEGPCSANADCELGACFDSKYCSLPCTSANAATVCAVTPFNGVCAPQGLCAKP